MCTTVLALTLQPFSEVSSIHAEVLGWVWLGGGVGVVAESVQWDQKLSKLPLRQ